MWALSWGPNVEFLTAIAEETGTVPPALAEKPNLTDREAYFFKVFNELSASRNFSEMPGPIPISECLSYCVFWEIFSQIDREDLFKFVTEMDKTYLKYQVEQREKRQKQSQPRK